MILKAGYELMCLRIKIRDQEMKEPITEACLGIMKNDQGTCVPRQVINVNSVREAR